MAEGVRASIAEFRGGNCLGADAQLFAAVDAGDISRRLEATRACYGCAWVDQCGMRLSHLALRMARRGVRQTVIGGIHSDNFLPIEALDSGGTEGPKSLEPLVLGNPSYSLDLIRGMVRSKDPVLQRGNYSHQETWQRWLGQDLPGVEPDGPDRLAYLLSKKLFNYTSRSHDDRRMIDRNFLYELGLLYVNDVAALREHSIPNCEQVGLRQSVKDYLAVADLFSSSPYLSASDIKKMFGNYPDDPLTALNNFVDRLLWSDEVVIPRLRREFNYTGPLEQSKVKEICRVAPRGFEAALYRWFENAASRVQRLGRAELVLTSADALAAGSAAYQRHIDAIDHLSASLTYEVAETTWADLEKIRALLRDGTLTHRGKAYDTQDARLLQYALRNMPESAERLQDIDLRLVAGFITGILRKYGDIVADRQLPEDWESRIRLALAYIEDVRALQALGVADPYRVARYSPASIIPKMHQLQQHRSLPPFAVDRALQQRVTDPLGWLEGYVVATDQICSRFLERTGVELAPNIAHFLGSSSLSNPIAVADRLVVAYLLLAAQYAHGDHLAGPTQRTTSDCPLFEIEEAPIPKAPPVIEGWLNEKIQQIYPEEWRAPIARQVLAFLDNGVLGYSGLPETSTETQSRELQYTPVASASLGSLGRVAIAHITGIDLLLYGRRLQRLEVVRKLGLPDESTLSDLTGHVNKRFYQPALEILQSDS